MKQLIMAAGLAVMLTACGTSEKKTVEGENPFFAEYTTPFGVPPFDQIKFEHYKPALLQGMEEGRKEIEAIVVNPDAPTFENTIVALDQSGELLTKVMYAFGGQSSVNTTDEIQELERELYPLLSKHSDDISLNPKLFARVKSVYENQASFHLDKEQKKLLEETYKSFVRGGANLPEDKQAKLRELNEKISMLQLTFGQNTLKETNAFQLVIDNKEDLSGLPEDVIVKAAQTAQENGLDGKWVFTLHNPSVMPFLQYADKRDLREKIFKAYTNRGNNNNENDNKEVVKQLVTARLEKARLMGYEDYAAFVLEENMAKNEKNVYDLLDKIWPSALAKAKEELADINAEIKKEGGNYEAEGWDWRYYFEKAKKAKYNLDENEMRPYFELGHVREGIFYVANKLYGITFTQRTDLPVPHPDALAFEVKEANGDHIGILYMDFHPRESKRSGAWMNSYRKQSALGKKVTPIITNVCNFTKPTGDVPALLSFDEAQTLFHEFGHALHGLLSQCTYNKVSGTSVPRDFVELPSQIMENWAADPEVLKVYARHYKTGEPIPQELIDKLENSGHFNQGFVTTEFMSAALLDMAYHTRNTTDPVNPNEFEKATLEKIGLIPEITVRYRSTYFQHIFAGGYSSGYYAYTWAEVLDADAFEAFKETGNIFNPEKAKAFRENILSKGGSEDAMTLYQKFRGQEPSIDPLLKRKGLK